MEDKENKRYLTEIKELPNEGVRQEGPTVEEAVKNKQPKQEPGKVEKKKKTKEVPKAVQKEPEEDIKLQIKEARPSRSYTTKDIILWIVNVVAVGGLIFLLLQLPEKAMEVFEARNEEIKASQKISVKLAEIEESKEMAQEIEAVFPDESGLVDFVKGIEDIRVEGTVDSISFASQKAVKDKTGNVGIPVLITMRGDWPRIGEDMAKIQDLPFIFRAVSIESRIDEEGVLIVEYGGFLYVDEKLGEN